MMLGASSRRCLRSAAASFSRNCKVASAFQSTMVRPLEEEDGEETVVQDMLQRIRKVNNMPRDIHDSLLEFRVDGTRLGKVRPKVAGILCEADTKSPVFEVVGPDQDSAKPYLTLTSNAGTSFESRSKSVARVTRRLHEEKIIRAWRNELYPVSDGFHNPALFVMERAATPFLGVTEYGVMINGIVTDPKTKVEKMWMARRSANKSKFPGMLDHIVAGGQPADVGLIDNVIEECNEEAGIPERLTRAGLKPAGAISHEHYNPRSDRVTRCVLFCFDLRLPSYFHPTPVDGEVEEFFLWTMDEVKASFAADFEDPLKPNCYPVVIDYLLRKGHVCPETPGYLDVLRELRSGDCC